MARFIICLVATVALVFAGSVLAEEAKKGPTTNVGGVKDAKGGTVSGMVKYVGKLVSRKPINMAGNAQCNTFWKGKFPRHSRWVFGKSKDGKSDTLANVLVYVSKGLAGQKFAAPKTEVLLDQKGCVYKPHIVALMAGQPLVISNSDPWMHNVTNLGLPKNNEPFNIAMPFEGKLPPMKFKAELKMRVSCSVHPWMGAYVHALDHPFFAVTGPDGSFKITGLPPGDYEVSVLHELPIFAAEKSTVTFKAEGGKTAEIEFTYSPKKRSK